MTGTWAPAAQALAVDLEHVFGPRLRSVVAYGPRLDGDERAPLTALALVADVGTTDLDACSRLAAGWRRSGIAIPLILPEQEFRTSLDVFPLEYAEILRAHAHVFGPDPFDGVAVSPSDLRHACEREAKSHLLHLREGYIEAGGRLQAVADLVTQAAPAFAALLRNVARLRGVESRDRMDATRQGARAAGLSEDVVSAVLALEHPSTLTGSDPAKLFPEYLEAVERLAKAVDAWRA